VSQTASSDRARLARRNRPFQVELPRAQGRVAIFRHSKGELSENLRSRPYYQSPQGIQKAANAAKTTQHYLKAALTLASNHGLGMAIAELDLTHRPASSVKQLVSLDYTRLEN
jgi:hypothetical protein